MLLVCLLAVPAAAQSSGNSRYSQNWGTSPSQAAPAPGGDSAAQRLVGELERLVDEAEKARAADPVFLRDLRALARRYDWPWSVRVLADDWSDGDASAGPAWRVTGGAISVDSRYGLRSAVTSNSLTMRPSGGSGTTATQPAAPKPAEPNPAEPTAEAQALQLFGQILAGQLQKKDDSGGPAPRAAAAPGFTELSTTVSISNAFALELDFSANARPAGSTGRLEFGVGQGSRALGYRLAARIGNAGGSTLQLLRIGAGGTTVSARVAAGIDLADGATHRLQLTRNRAGTMRLLVDGTPVAELSDRAFNDGFDRIVIVNRGGDYTLRGIAAYGVN